jgi:hypothetical protein
MMPHQPTRRSLLTAAAANVSAAGVWAVGARVAARRAGGPATAPAPGGWRLSTFKADVTPPLGHPVLGDGSFPPARLVADPLLAKGMVLEGQDRPVVLAAVDWCELRNDAYARWRAALAAAAGTSADRVLLSCVHQHDAPYFDLMASTLLAESPRGGKMGDAAFHEAVVGRVTEALKAARASARPVTHLGMGQAKVERVASNRRVVLPGGRVTFGRYSRCRDPVLRDLPEGEIDPWLKTLSFWEGDRPLAAFSAYACHPMSHYGRGEVSCDFVGLAREQREKDAPGVFQVYANGCAGDVTAGKYNDGARENRAALAERVRRGMNAAWNATKRQPLGRIASRSVPVLLPHSEFPGMTTDRLRERLRGDPLVSKRADAALGLSSLRRNPLGHAIDIQALDFGTAQVLLLPAESFVAYQLLAQKLRPDSFVIAVGYGECAPGYIPTDAAFAEGYREEHGYCWVRPGAEKLLADGMKKALEPERAD